MVKNSFKKVGTVSCNFFKDELQDDKSMDTTIRCLIISGGYNGAIKSLRNLNGVTFRNAQRVVQSSSSKQVFAEYVDGFCKLINDDLQCDDKEIK